MMAKVNLDKWVVVVSLFLIAFNHLCREFTNHFRGGRSGSGTDDSSMLSFRVGPNWAKGQHNNNICFQQHPRGSGSSTIFSRSHTGGRPMSCVGSMSSSGTTTHLSGSGEQAGESEFWQDEDWESMELDAGSCTQQPTQQSTTNSQTRCAEQNRDAAPLPTAVVDQLGKAVAGIRLHSKSCSLDPPPGFALPSSPPHAVAPHPATVPPPSTSSKQQQQCDVQQQQPPSVGCVVEPLQPSCCESRDSVPESAPTPLLGQPVDPTRWYYIDLEGRTQGPFNNQQMSGWMASGFLPLAIKIRRDCDECFLSLVDHMHLAGRVPFWKGYTRPPITRALVASMSAANESRWPAALANVGSPSAVPTTLPQPLGVSAGLLISDGVVSNPLTTACDLRANEDGVQSPIVLFPATASAVLQQQQQAPPLAQQQIPTCMPEVVPSPLPPFSQPAATPAVATTVDHTDIIRLYSEAQKLVANAVSVQQVERQQLVDRLAAINSTATAMLLASTTPSLLPPAATAAAGGSMLGQQPVGGGAPAPGGCAGAPGAPQEDALFMEHSDRQLGLLSCPLASVVEPTMPVPSSRPPEGQSEQQVDEQEQYDEDEEEDKDDEQEDQPIDTGDQRTQDRDLRPPTEAFGETAGCCSSLPSDGAAAAITGGVGEPGRKSKKKKKSKKSKPSAEQERQAAWEAEFERRRAAARERQAAQDAELAALAAEEAAALAEKQARLASEQSRAVLEQRRRDAQRARQDVQLSQLQLPTSAKWGGGTSEPAAAATAMPVSVASAAMESPANSCSLLAIQAAQALEEAERKRQESLQAEQHAVALAVAAAAAASARARPTAWAAVVQPQVKPGLRTGVATVAQARGNLGGTTATATTLVKPSRICATATTTLTQVYPQTGRAGDPPAPRSQGEQRSKPVNSAAVGNNARPVVETTAAAKTGHTATLIESIWDLPVGGSPTGSGQGKNTKKHNKKKNASCSREAASFAAKEELAHWCEAQLSSLPLPSVDLPTLVDLLCELEAADQVVEFIETSLGRSKQITQFSKAFLEKRACMLKAMP